MSKTEIRRIAIRALINSIHYHNQANWENVYAERIKRETKQLFILMVEELDEPIEVHVRGGVADCDDQRVEIIDHDNLDEDEAERKAREEDDGVLYEDGRARQGAQ